VTGSGSAPGLSRTGRSPAPPLAGFRSASAQRRRWPACQSRPSHQLRPPRGEQDAGDGQAAAGVRGVQQRAHCFQQRAAALGGDGPALPDGPAQQGKVSPRGAGPGTAVTLPARHAQRSKKPRLAARLTRHFFKRYINRRYHLEAGKKPDRLKGSTPSKRAWRSFLSLQNRGNPILLAERILKQSQLPSCPTLAQVAEHFGISRPMVSYHLALVTRLPASFVDWLRACDDPIVLKFFSERRLRPVTRIADPVQQAAALDLLVREAQQFVQGQAAASPPSTT